MYIGTQVILDVSNTIAYTGMQLNTLYYNVSISLQVKVGSYMYDFTSQVVLHIKWYITIEAVDDIFTLVHDVSFLMDFLENPLVLLKVPWIFP